MTQHLSRLGGATSSPVDDWQLGPDTDEWPGEQKRRLDDHYRSWRQDRYRESSDERGRSRQGRAHNDDRRERGLAR